MSFHVRFHGYCLRRGKYRPPLVPAYIFWPLPLRVIGRLLDKIDQRIPWVWVPDENKVRQGGRSPLGAYKSPPPPEE